MRSEFTLNRYASIVGWGYALPSKVLTNHDLAQMVDTSDEWIRSRTGIVERRVIGPGESTASLARAAGERALEVAGISAEDLDVIIVATITPDYPFPSVAAMVQDGLGATRAGAFDLNAACAGFVYSLSVGTQLVTSGVNHNVLIIGSDTLSQVIDWSDRSTCVLFGDGAGAVVIQATEQRAGIQSSVLGSDGSGFDHLIVPAGGSLQPASRDTVDGRRHYLKMNGNEVYRFAVTAMIRSTAQAIKQANLSSEDIDLFIPHQANLRIIQYAAKALNLPAERVFTNVDRYGNTSSASIPIALCEAIERGLVQPGHNLALVGFGAGLTWAAGVIRWTAEPVASRANDNRLLAEPITS